VLFFVISLYKIIIRSIFWILAQKETKEKWSEIK